MQQRKVPMLPKPGERRPPQARQMIPGFVLATIVVALGIVFFNALRAPQTLKTDRAGVATAAPATQEERATQEAQPSPVYSTAAPAEPQPAAPEQNDAPPVVEAAPEPAAAEEPARAPVACQPAPAPIGVPICEEPPAPAAAAVEAAPAARQPLRIRSEDSCDAEHGRCPPPCEASEHGRCEKE